MEQHPIPRNISGFQFHLIGDMTLRQFGYLAGGAFCAYLIFRMAPFPDLFRYPLAGFFGLIGFAFAFLPIQERPLDKWLLAFIKSITSPTQFVWTKDNQPSDFFSYMPVACNRNIQSVQINTHNEARIKLEAYLSSLPKTPHEAFNTREKKYIDSTLSLFQTSAVAVNSTIVPATNPQISVPSSSPVKTPFSSAPVAATPLAQQTDDNEKPAVKIEPDIHAPQPQPVIQTSSFEYKTDNGLSNLNKQLEELAAQKKQLEEELNRLKQDLSSAQTQKIVRPLTDKEAASEPTIKTISPKAAVNEVGLSNNQYPNIITGVLKDPQRKILQNVILTIKDKSGTPLRALKTNKLGQFATATPLPNGTYLIEAEDPMKRYNFDIAQIVLSGKVYPAIEIVAKGEKEIMREKLSKELFGNQSASI